MSRSHGMRVHCARVAGAGLWLLSLACSSTDRLAEARANHAVELLGFSVERAPGSQPFSPDGEAGAEAPRRDGGAFETSASGGAEAESRLLVADAERSTVRLRMKVRRAEARYQLPGITVEAVLQDGETGGEKEAYRVWLPLGGSWPGGERVVEAELAGVPYREGDTFEVTLRAQVPQVERSLYREFAQR